MTVPSTGAVLQPGEMAPDFTLPDAEGHALTLSDLRGRTVVLYFFPKAGTPGCIAEARSFRRAWRELRAQGAEVLGVSPDSVSSHQKFIRKLELPFTLLSDEEGAVAQRYGVWVQKHIYGRHYMGTARATFLIWPDGQIGNVWQQVKPQGHGIRVLEFIKSRWSAGA